MSNFVIGFKFEKLYQCIECNLVSDSHRCPECRADIRKSRIKFLKKK